MRYILTVYNTIDLPASDVRTNGLEYVLKLALLEVYSNKIIANNYVLALTAFEYDNPIFSHRDSSQFTVPFKAEFETEKFYPGRVLMNCRIDNDSDKLMKATYKLPDGYEVPIIVTAKSGTPLAIGEFATPLIITNIATRGISTTLRCVAEILTPLIALDFVNDFNYPHTLAHYNDFPAGINQLEFVMPNSVQAGYTSYDDGGSYGEFEGGAKKPLMLSSFYYKFDTTKTRKTELFYHLVSRIVGTTVSVEPAPEKKAFISFLKKNKIPIRVESSAPQTIVFTSAKKAHKDVAGMSNIDVAVIDDTLDNLPSELEYIDIYKPICSPRYFVIVTTDGLTKSKTYCQELLEMDRQRREQIDKVFSNYKIPADLSKTATNMYKKTFK